MDDVRRGAAANAFELQLLDVLGQLKCTEHLWPERKFTPEELGTDGPAHGDPNAFVASLIEARKRTIATAGTACRCQLRHLIAHRFGQRVPPLRSMYESRVCQRHATSASDLKILLGYS